MTVLGISGLENSMAFKRSHWPDLEEREYRISQGHDSAAALVIDGRLVAAAAEERFSRKKHTGDFPIGAISYCLAEAGLQIRDVDELVHAFDYSPYREIYQLDAVSAELYRDVLSMEALQGHVSRYFAGFPLGRVSGVSHHLAHASSAYFGSGWDECLVVVDEMGRAALPAVTHLDGSARVQTVSATDNPEFHALLRAVGRATGREVVLNIRDRQARSSGRWARNLA